MKQNGQFLQEDFFSNTGGLNLTDSPMVIKASQATGGANFVLALTGGLKKRFGHEKMNSSADTQLNTLGYAQYGSSTGTKFEVRAAGTKLQYVSDRTAPPWTNLTEDTVGAGSDFLTSGSTQPVVFSQFNTADKSVLWTTGGGMAGIYGIYSTSKVTKNGAAVAAGSISTSVSTGTSTFAATGTYYYAVVLRKASTQVLSNATLDKPATISATTQKVTINLATITSFDTTKYDQIYIYRSAVAGVEGFTTGDLIAQLASTTTSYEDTGTAILESESVPRANDLILDNSEFTAGTPKVLTLFKRRLVAALNGTLYFSDVNKPESWPTANTITLPSAGEITALGIISFSTQFGTDEYLAIYKEQELWVLTGNDLDDYVLKFIDKVGCPSQSLLVQANGFLTWVDYRGIYVWDGSDKPIYASRPIETIFAQDGNLDKSFLPQGIGSFFRTQNCAVWYLSDKVYGEQKLAIRLDLRLTLPQVENTMNGRILDGVFTFESSAFPIYAVATMIPSDSKDEEIILGDASGFIYRGYTQQADAGSAIDFQYYTPFLNMGDPNIDKRFHKVIVWVEEVGDWNITVDYWTGYRAALNQMTTQALPISTALTSGTALYDIAQWDAAFWDDYIPKLRGIVFNLQPGVTNSNEGECIRFRFRQDGANEPVTIIGYSVLYSETGGKG